MPFLIVHESGHTPRLFELPSQRITIGRAPGCELVLANVSVSREHATLEVLRDGQARVVSKADHNPVLVNEVPVEAPTDLAHGAHMRVGKFKLTWLHESQMDAYRMHQLAEMPRFNRLGQQDSNATYALSGALHKKMLQSELLRECGALTTAGGTAHPVGAEPVSIGPDDPIPCDSRWGRRTAAVIQWAGGSHEVKVTGLFAKLKVNGESTQSQVLRPGDTVSVNGTEFTYGVDRSPRR